MDGAIHPPSRRFGILKRSCLDQDPPGPFLNTLMNIYGKTLPSRVCSQPSRLGAEITLCVKRSRALASVTTSMLFLASCMKGELCNPFLSVFSPLLSFGRHLPNLLNSVCLSLTFAFFVTLSLSLSSSLSSLLSSCPSPCLFHAPERANVRTRHLCWSRLPSRPDEPSAVEDESSALLRLFL